MMPTKKYMSSASYNNQLICRHNTKCILLRLKIKSIQFKSLCCYILYTLCLKNVVVNFGNNFVIHILTNFQNYFTGEETIKFTTTKIEHVYKFPQLAKKANERLFWGVRFSEHHVLQHLLPDIISHRYSLRPRRHSFVLTTKIDQQNFIVKQLFSDIY